mmetsp:Transcript_122710/g.244101  ORF Transcript_122710/g.244101 Transcript_122710/m.244101 type:complete len:324 (+) Transcript_122710:3-974(+)
MLHLASHPTAEDRSAELPEKGGCVERHPLHRPRLHWHLEQLTDLPGRSEPILMEPVLGPSSYEKTKPTHGTLDLPYPRCSLKQAVRSEHWVAHLILVQNMRLIQHSFWGVHSDKKLLPLLRQCFRAAHTLKRPNPIGDREPATCVGAGRVQGQRVPSRPALLRAGHELRIGVHHDIVLLKRKPTQCFQSLRLGGGGGTELCRKEVRALQDPQRLVRMGSEDHVVEGFQINRSALHIIHQYLLLALHKLLHDLSDLNTCAYRRLRSFQRHVEALDIVCGAVLWSAPLRPDTVKHPMVRHETEDRYHRELQYFLDRTAPDCSAER